MKYLKIYNEWFSKEAGEEAIRIPFGKAYQSKGDVFHKSHTHHKQRIYRQAEREKALIEKTSIAMRRRRVEVREHFDGEITVKFNDGYVSFKEIFDPKSAKIVKVYIPMRKTAKKEGKYIQPPDHPWRRHHP